MIEIGEIPKSLLTQLKYWGGEFKQVESFDQFKGNEDFSHAPFTAGLGILWNEFTILMNPHFNIRWPEIVHEMGHVFASSRPPKKSNEWEFFGWEIALVRHLDLNFEEWVKSNYDYAVIPPAPECSKWSVDFGRISKECQELAIEEAIKLSTSLGLIRDGKPINIRG